MVDPAPAMSAMSALCWANTRPAGRRAAQFLARWTPSAQRETCAVTEVGPFLLIGACSLEDGPVEDTRDEAADVEHAEHGRQDDGAPLRCVNAWPPEKRGMCVCARCARHGTVASGAIKGGGGGWARVRACVRPAAGNGSLLRMIVGWRRGSRRGLFFPSLRRVASGRSSGLIWRRRSDGRTARARARRSTAGPFVCVRFDVAS